MNDKEYLAYKEFCIENFPTSKWSSTTGNPIQKQIFTSYYKSVEMLYIFSETTAIKDNEVAHKLSSDISYLIKNLLYTLPLNNKLLYSSAIRSLSEAILRICYFTIFPQTNYEDINRLPFNELSTQINSNRTLTVIFSDPIGKIISKFGEHSRIIHNTGNTQNTINFLQDIIAGDNLNNNVLKNESDIFFKFCSQVYPFIFNITELNYSTAQKIRLSYLK